MFVESQDSNISDDQDKSFCESSTNPLNYWLWKFKEDNCFDDESDLENELKLAWWPKADADRIPSSQEEYVDNQFLDVKVIDYSDIDNLEMPIYNKTNKSAEEKRRSANDAYNK